MVSKSYSLRPPTAGDKDVGLETLFRIEMKRDDLASEGLKSGEAISVISQTTGKGGVGIAWLSTETAKSQGNTSFVKMHPKLREFMGLELSDKCCIARYEGTQQVIQSMAVSLTGKCTADANSEDIVHWAGVALGRLVKITLVYESLLTNFRTASMHHQRRCLQCHHYTRYKCF